VAESEIVETKKEVSVLLLEDKEIVAVALSPSRTPTLFTETVGVTSSSESLSMILMVLLKLVFSVLALKITPVTSKLSISSIKSSSIVSITYS